MELQELLDAHNKFKEILVKIPESRIMTCHYSYKDNNPKIMFFKPRFNPSVFKLSQFSYYKDLIKHLRNIRLFLEERDYWYDEAIKETLKADKGLLSKKSVIFLLERDIWETDEIYGLYLVELKSDHTIISYYRRNEKRFSYKFNSIHLDEIKKEIMTNARKQVIKRFSILWDLIYYNLEISSNFKLKKNNNAKLIFLKDDLIKQFNESKSIFESHPILGVLGLGRVAELWIKFIIKIKIPYIELNNQKNIRFIALENNVINRAEYKFLSRIAHYYNKLKHNLDFDIFKDNEISNIQELFSKFENIFLH